MVCLLWIAGLLEQTLAPQCVCLLRTAGPCSSLIYSIWTSWPSMHTSAENSRPMLFPNLSGQVGPWCMHLLRTVGLCSSPIYWDKLALNAYTCWEQWAHALPQSIWMSWPSMHVPAENSRSMSLHAPSQSGTIYTDSKINLEFSIKVLKWYIQYMRTSILR